MYSAGPLFATSMLATITYPLAVRVARSRRLFGLRNYYAIHLAIAPFLAMIHLNFFALVRSYIRAKAREREFHYVRTNAKREFQDIVSCKVSQSQVTKGMEPYGFYFY